MKKHYDMVIANPPYSCGNQVVRAILDGVDFDEFINLMPLSCYKSQELYKHVKGLTLVDPDSFYDASITDNLNVAVLTKEELNITYEDLELLTFKEELRAYYSLNSHIKPSYKILPNMPNFYNIDENPLNFNIATDFMITTRTAQDGVHKTAAHDMRYNIERQPASTLAYMIRLTETGKNNLCRFWYRNQLQNALIKGLNQSSGRCTAAIPNLDWTKDRDYENATLEDIMN